MCYIILFYFFFFFQAEDGIRDYKVTGVQTCALPICLFFLRKSFDEIGCHRTGHGLPQKGARFRKKFQPDRKSTRLNPSHLVISYAVFCLKKKKIYLAKDIVAQETHLNTLPQSAYLMMTAS